MNENKNDTEKMEALKRAYQNPEMSDGQLSEMRRRIEEAKMEKRKASKVSRLPYYAATAAVAVIIIFVVLPNASADIAYAMSNIPIVGKMVEAVTFRNYHYESERNNADIEVPELTVHDEVVTVDTEQTAEEAEQTVDDSGVQESLKKTTEEINAEIQEITDKLVAEFEENLENEGGYQDIVVTHEVLGTTDDYFTLKLSCYQDAGSGSAWDYFYTIDLNSGEQLALKDLFEDGADYITPISENIKEQMRAQMAEDDTLTYWVDYDDVPAWNFEAITDETLFYVNEDGNIVISFNEGDVAPRYMGCVEFVIPDEVTAGIMK